VDVYVSLDQKNVSRRLLNFDQGGLGLGSGARDYYLNDTRHGKQLKAYARYMTQKVRQISHGLNLIYLLNCANVCRFIHLPWTPGIPGQRRR
jgi:predicted metalloendopeptidase